MTKWKAILIISIPIVLAGGIPPAIDYIHEEIVWNEFTDNLAAIGFTSNEKPVDELKDFKGVWKPTEEEFKEIYKYVYGENMVVWQTIDGTEMCPKREDGLGYENCIPQWEQEYNNARERGEKMENVIKGIRDGVRIENVPKKESKIFSKISSFFKNLIESAYAALQFYDTFTVTSNTYLQDHTSDSGIGWTKKFCTGYGCSENFVVADIGDQLEAHYDRTSSGYLWWTNNIMTTSDVKVSVKQVWGGTGSSTGAIACRWSATNPSTDLYIFIWNTERNAIWGYVGGWTKISSDGGGIAAGSIVTMFCHGNVIEVFDDGVLINSNNLYSASEWTGHVGVGAGAIMTGNSTEGWWNQGFDDFQANAVRNIMISSTFDN